MTENLSIFGSTGSIGTQALSLVKQLGINITAISGHSNVELLEKQALEFKPKTVCMTDENAAKSLKIKLAHTDIKVVFGKQGLIEIAREDKSDTVLNSVVGVAGLEPTIEAIKAKKNIALANKETLVVGGKLITDIVKQNDVAMLPVDSEHSAIFQCLEGAKQNRLKKIFLTASGGPFFKYTKKQLETVTLEDALRHPNWSMGKKITVDSATLMNKGLELIEAMRLFDIAPDDIEITVHRQSIIHSMIEFEDNSVIAQLGLPDMRIPIQFALTYPKRISCPVEPLTIEKMGSLTFEKADCDTFVCLKASITAARRGGTATCIVNAANERAVELFLDNKIRFLEIGEAVLSSLDNIPIKDDYTLEDLIETDILTRNYVDKIVGR